MKEVAQAVLDAWEEYCDDKRFACSLEEFVERATRNTWAARELDGHLPSPPVSRDELAETAMAAIIAKHPAKIFTPISDGDSWFRKVATGAYSYADAMAAESKKKRITPARDAAAATLDEEDDHYTEEEAMDEMADGHPEDGCDCGQCKDGYVCPPSCLDTAAPCPNSPDYPEGCPSTCVRDLNARIGSNPSRPDLTALPLIWPNPPLPEPPFVDPEDGGDVVKVKELPEGARVWFALPID